MNQDLANIKYIESFICKTERKDKIEVLCILLNNGLEDKIVEKSSGSQIKFSEIPSKVIEEIHLFLKSVEKREQEKLEQLCVQDPVEN